MKEIDKILRQNSLVITVCNYAQVRSQCMAETLRRYGFGNVSAYGVLSSPTQFTKLVFDKAALLIICNWKNLEDGFLKDNFYDPKTLVLLMNQYKIKSIWCTDIEYDRWGDKNHPKLVEICENFVKGLL